MKPLNIGMTGNQAISGALLKDVFCLAWIGSESVDEVFTKLKALGFSGSLVGIKARAIRIRKAKRHPLDLPKLDGEGATHKNWNRVQAALLARQSNDDRHVAQLELADILKNS